MAKNRFDKETISRNISRKYIKEKYIEQINDTRNWKKKTTEKGLSEKNITGEVRPQGRKDVGVGFLLLDNDKNKVIADKKCFATFGKK